MVFDMVGAIRSKGYDQPIVLMTYSNPVLRMGVADFCSRASKAGADAVLMVDMPPEESAALDSSAEEKGRTSSGWSHPRHPTRGCVTGASRAPASRVSAAGVTGARSSLPESARSLLGRLAPNTSLPVVLGFGISAPEHVGEAIKAGARGVVEGSALVSMYAPLLRERDRARDAIAAHASVMKAAAIR
jgi:tryptophan synthase alpha chain